MNLMETLTLFMVIFSFLGLIVDVIRPTVEVVDKFYQKKPDDNKKRLTASSVQAQAVNLFD